MTTIGITMGCPAGIGPEIILRYYMARRWPAGLQPIVIGDIGVLKRCATELNLQDSCISWQPGSEPIQGTTPVLSVSDLNAQTIQWGQPNNATAHAMVHYIETAVRLTQDGFLHGITTCPISKDALNNAGYNFPGHTEMLADLTSSSNYAMMMAGKSLRVTLVTIHCPLAKVPELLTPNAVFNLITITSDALRNDFGIARPRIAVAGLNPHAGENNLFGTEEGSAIVPAIEKARKENIEVSGPYPPDTVFFKATKGDFDAVVCMYHDQGLIPFKLLHFHDGVNVTLGLPIVRTSVDHGTGYDIAGKGVASPESLSEAVQLAADISTNRATVQTTGNS